ncbi:peptidase [Cellulophaga phage phi40:1]|nr:peptidase [Cellulophaga phage phi40:1]
MARIKNTDVYVFDNVPESSSFLVGSDQGDGRITKSYRIDTIFGILPSYGYFTDAPRDGQPYLRQNGSWALVPASGVGSVFSVFGQTGAIEAKEDDYKDFYSLLGHTHTESEIIDLGDYLESVNISDINATGSANSNTFLRGDGVWADASNINSVFGRGGEVTAEEGDYSGFYSLLGHTHNSSEIDDFNSELSGKNNTTAYTPTGDYNVSTKKYVDDSISSYNRVTGVFGRDGEVTAEEGDYSGFYSLLGHTHLESDITDLGNYLESVNIGDINALGTPTSDNFLRGDGNWASIATSLSGLSDVTLGSVLSGEVLRHNGTVWENKKITIADIDNFPSYELLSNKGASNGYAPLNASGLIDSGYLPSFVDDVLEFNDYASFPLTGETGKIYIDLYENNLYRWGGSNYIPVGGTEAINWGAITGTLSNQTDLQSALDGKLGTLGTAYNSNLLGGFNSGQFLRSDTSDTMNGTLGVLQNINVGGSLDVDGNSNTSGILATQEYLITKGSSNGLRLQNPISVGDAADIYMSYYDSVNTRMGYVGFGSQSSSDFIIRNDMADSTLTLSSTGTKDLKYSSNGITGTVWHSANDGIGSGLDADRFRGLTESSSGDRFNIVPVVSPTGVMEIGRYVDFHDSDEDTSDYSNRLSSNGASGLTASGNFTSSKELRSENSGENARLLYLATERPWYFKQGLTGGTTRLSLISTSASKVFTIGDETNDDNFIVNASSGSITTQGEITANGNNIYTENCRIRDNGIGALIVSASGDGVYLRPNGDGSVAGQFEISSSKVVTSNHIEVTAAERRVAYSVWSGSTYGIGMGSGYTYGALSGYAMTFQMNSDAGRGWWWGKSTHSNAQGAMSLANDGRLTVGSTVTATNFILSSDKRLKENIKEYKPLDLSFKAVTFDWIDKEHGGTQTGYIAQDVEMSNPQFVNTDNNGFKSVKYIDVLVAKMAEKDIQIESLEERVEILEEKLNLIVDNLL